MHAKLAPPSLESVLGSASAVAAGRLAGEGPAGRLPLTPDMLREEPSGNLFGLTQNVGMGWSPASLGGPQYVIVSTHGGLRSEDGSPVALGYHTGHWEIGLLVRAAAETLRAAGAIPFAAYCSDPCDGRTQGTTGMFDSLPYRNDAAVVMRRLIRSLPTASGVIGVATCDKGLPATMLALAGKLPAPGERQHRRGQALVARGDADHARCGGERADQAAHHDGRVVAIGQAVEHPRGALGAAVARVATVRRKRDRPRRAQRFGRRPDQEADLPVPGVVTQRHRAPVFAAQATVGADDDVLRAAQGRGAPAHAHVLRQTEDVAARLLAQHVGGEGQPPRRPFTREPAGGYGACRAEHRIERRRSESPVHVHNVAAADGGSPATCRGAACCAPTSMMTDLYAAAAAGAGPASTNCLVTGSIRRLSPSRVRDPSNTRSPGCPNTTSSAARFPAT